MEFKCAWLWQNERWADLELNVFAAGAEPDAQPLHTLMLHSMLLGIASPGHFRGHCERTQDQGKGPASAEGGKRRTPELSSRGAQGQPSDDSAAGAQAEPAGTDGAAKRAKHAHEPGEPTPDRQDSTADGPVYLQCSAHSAPVLRNISIQPTTPAYQYRLTLFSGEPESVPRAVLCHLYTGALPDEPDQLIWMLRRADYLDLADTVHAVLQKLRCFGSKQLTLQHAAQLTRLPDMQCGAGQAAPASQPPAAGALEKTAAAAAAPSPAPAQTAAAVDAGTLAPAFGQPAAAAAPPGKTAAALLQELIDSLLLAHLPSAPAIVTDAALLTQFTQLPLALVQRWVELDQYEVDSGNTLAVLFTAWHDAQPEPPSEEQCKQLSDMLPLAAVSLCFHTQVLQKLKWWRSRMVWDKPALESHVFAELETDCDWADVAGGASVAKRATQRTTYTRTVTAEQLKQLWKDKSLTLPHTYFAGYMLGAQLQLQYDENDSAQAGPVHLILLCDSAWPTPLQQSNLAERQADMISSSYVINHLGQGSTGSLSSWWDTMELSKADWHPVLQFASLQALVPDATTTMSVACELEALSKA